MATTMTGLAAAPPGRALVVRHQRTFFGAVIPSLLFFMIAFPKGGVRIYDVPITFGYLLTPYLLLGALLRGHVRRVPSDRLYAFLPALLLAAWSAAVVAINGTDAIGYTLSYFISALYLPIFGLVFFSDLTMSDNRARIEGAFRWAVRFVLIYGLFLFVYKLATGRWIEVPYLTVNADDVGNLESKFINRGSIYKLISTYNNGNILGVALCVLGPLYLRLEKRRFWSLVFYGVLFLTLSRTVWIGALVILLFSLLSNKLRPITFFYIAAALLASAVVINFILDLMGRDLDFIFDKTLGNRADQLNAFIDPRVVPDRITTVLPEIVYTGVLGNYGYPGLLIFIVHLVMPVILLLAAGTRIFSRNLSSACLQGLAVYPVLAASDSAYNFPPVMMIFWMIVGLGFWYAHDERRRRRWA